MKRPVQSRWIAALEIAADAVYRQDGGVSANETGWRSDEKREAWIAIRKEISRLENAGFDIVRGHHAANLNIEDKAAKGKR